ncbi:hypothetical protein C2869_01930 [Saccharobesus litoralis]|uniref:Uncharacterized protein n=1 Tax=Saccharobesus litoralis TaxID=2172099 RepID=A0A2S0VM67_9ALTE|nr:hypothetical protein C2869_01930 [Saccharobesus litoralis]
MKCFCCDGRFENKEMVHLDTKNYCRPCAIGLFGDLAKKAPPIPDETNLKRFESHTKVFFALISGFWFFIFLYDLVTGVSAKIRTKYSSGKGKNESR